MAEAARELDHLRNNWLNAPEWTRTEILEFPGSTDGPWARYIVRPVDGPVNRRVHAASSAKVAPSGPDGAAAATTSPSAPTSALRKRSSPPPASEGFAGLPSVGLVRFPRLVPKDAECAKELKKRTLTNLYNARPAWLDLAHQKLDAAVFAAYGWPASLTDDELLAKLLELNLSRAK